MDLHDKILVALEQKPLTNEELAASLGVEDDAFEYTRELYILNLESFIQKHPVIDGGCKTCACQVTYKWKLTRSGRDLVQTLQR